VTLANELPTISQRPGPLRPIAAVKAPRSLMVAALVFIAQCAGFFHPPRHLSANPKSFLPKHGASYRAMTTLRQAWQPLNAARRFESFNSMAN
jgi:hypothetical protein